MTAVADPETELPAKKSKKPLIIGIVLALLGGGGGFFAVSAGLLPFGAATESHADDKAPGDEHAADAGEHSAGKGEAAAFVTMEPLVISIQDTNGTRFLRFSAQLDVSPAYQAEVEAVMPRIVDVLNGYLRAVKLSDLSDPSILTRLRSQLLRRIQVVTGPGQVRDLLIMEFVLN